jgi:hypothetical protein
MRRKKVLKIESILTYSNKFKLIKVQSIGHLCLMFKVSFVYRHSWKTNLNNIKIEIIFYEK